MTLLVFGYSGQVASELRRIAFDATFLSRKDVDLGNPQACYDIIVRHQPSAIINAAAYTQVDQAEDEEDLANLINGAAPKEMARAAAELGVPIVHISTDYVFNGESENSWQVGDQVAPVGAYGRSKLMGEIAVRESGAVFAILRTSWVFSSFGNNFVKTMLRLAKGHDELSIVADQIGGPTAAADIANAVLKIAEGLVGNEDKSGIYHFSGGPDVSWANFAEEIFSQNDSKIVIHPILSKDFPTKAVRPKNSRMNCDDITKAFKIQRPDWRDGLSVVLKELNLRG